MIWPIAIVCGIVFGSLVLSGAYGAMHPVMQLSVAAVIVTVGAMMSFIQMARKRAKFTMVPVVWAVAVLVLMASWSFREQGRLLALTLLERPVEDLAPPVGSLQNEVMLMRAWDGHFRAVAEVNGTPVGLLIDTGASRVLLRYDDARRIGLTDADLNYTLPVTTASGRAFVAPVTFDRIEIGGIIVRDVQGAVAQPDQLHSSLLGMSYIEHLTEAVIRKDRLILRN
ncbi:aspartyl protease family protein [Rubricella aquisinus]|uniref:Aspartyl protease family protein n=1 Tax=Rubricella aquisinus TaxID=2028108 RepID=A0A840WJK1_9RHOB|nr:TIGR02281 family clan AA aspartic protease [Rubricella aquisinus]MBB5515259.1 aspartyl protease family protein [Rubricella aquisinus]